MHIFIPYLETGHADDTAAINRAIQDAERTGSKADSSTVAPALVYLPPGRYRVSRPIIAYYNTHILGDPMDRPTLVPFPHFEGIAVIDENPYEPGGRNWYIPQNNFFRSVANLVIDLTEMPQHTGTGIHHQVSQSTGLSNIHFEMRIGGNTQQQGVFMENGSGGFMSDLSFTGGRFGAWLGNQQFTVRNARFRQCKTAICQHWNWAWTYMDIDIEHCQVGLEMLGMLPDKQGVGSLILSDWYVRETQVAVQLELAYTGRLVLDAFHIENVPAIVQEMGQTPLLASNSSKEHISFWLKCPSTAGTKQWEGLKVIDNASGAFYAGFPNPSPKRPSGLVDPQGRWFGQEKPQFASVPAPSIISVRTEGAKGDGVTNDTVALQATLIKHVGSVIYVPYGVYLLRDTLHIPIGTKLVGEAQSMFVGTGIMFDDAQKPRPVIRVGSPGEVGDLVICDLIFTTRGPAAGAVVVEWNVREKTQGSVAMFDTHIRIGGTQGTNLELDTCGKDKPLHELPRASFLNLHLTKKSSGYFQNVWIWTADHELDQGAPEQLNILSGRGVLIESQGPVWMYGTASEHQLLYQYSLVNAHNVILAMIQTESPYFQGQHFAPASVCEVRSKSYPDPDCAKRYDSQGAYNQEQEDRAVGLHIENCQDIYVYGAGMYSFFDSYAQDTLPEHACQRRLCTIDDGHGESSRIWMLNMATVGSEILLSVDGRDYYPEKPFREGFCSTATMCLIDSTAQEKIAVL